MGAASSMTRERDIEAYLSEHVRRLGGLSYKLAPTTAGLPDRLLVLPGGRIVLVEVKRPGGKLRRVQEEIRRRLTARGVEVLVIYNKDDVRKLIK